MAKRYYTKQADVKVYDNDGVHGPTIKFSNTEVAVVQKTFNPLRGEVFEIRSPFSGYVRTGMLREVITPDPAPPGEGDPDPTPETELPSVLRGFDDLGLPIPGAVWKRE